MSIYDIESIGEKLKNNDYAGRGIVTGLSSDGKKAVFAYFIMGRSANSRNRVFREKDGEVVIYPFDESKVEDPSLIIYSPVRSEGKRVVVTNGDQTDTIVDFLRAGKTFEEALETRCFEPDAPNFTPRISAVLDFEKGYTYKQSILKSGDENGTVCNRYTFSYTPIAGLGHFIHTYNHNGNPIPTFTGEPERVKIGGDIDAFTAEIGENLDKENKISLYVRYIDIESGAAESRMINKNK